MKIISAYIRVSTDEQVEKGNSIQEQKERLSAFCRANGWSQPEYYIDDGYSAKDLNRPGIQHLLDDVRAGKVQSVLTTKLDRLSRNLLDILQLVNIFTDHGCNYVSASESFDASTAAGKMMLQLLGTFAEFERERISERVKENMLSLAKNTNKAIYQPCYGYEIDENGQFVINEEEAKFVRLMFDLAEQGHGPRMIAKILNEHGARTKAGKPWDQVNVKRLIKNERVAGIMIYNKRQKKGNRVVFRDKGEWIVKENNHPAIIPPERFEKVQEILRSRSLAKRHAESETYLLTGLVKCAHCGKNMKGSTARYVRGDKSYTYYRYICSSYVLGYGCKHHAIHRDDLENLIIQTAKKIANASETELKISIAPPSSVAEQIKHIHDQLARIEQRMQKQIEAYENDLISAHDLKLARKRIESERKELLERLKEVEKRGTTLEDVRRKAEELLDVISGDDRVKAKHALRQLFQEIHIENGEIVHITLKR